VKQPLIFPSVCSRDRTKQKRPRRDLDLSLAQSKRTVVSPRIERSRRETRVSRSESNTKRQRSRFRRSGPSTRAVKARWLAPMPEKRVVSRRPQSRGDSSTGRRHFSIVVSVPGCNDIDFATWQPGLQAVRCHLAPRKPLSRRRFPLVQGSDRQAGPSRRLRPISRSLPLETRSTLRSS
jgi:hypothetical protein